MSTSDSPNLERLYMVRASLNKMARELRTSRQQVAREIEAAEQTIDSPQEDTRNDGHRSEAD